MRLSIILERKDGKMLEKQVGEEKG